MWGIHRTGAARELGVCEERFTPAWRLGAWWRTKRRGSLIERSVDHRKDKRAIRTAYVTQTRPYCCVRSRSKCFLLSSAGFIRGGWVVATSHPSSLLSTQALRMFLNSLILSLVLTWASLRSAHAMPTSKMVVELSACGMTPETSSELLPQQVSIL